MKLSTQILLAFGVVIFLSIVDSYTNYMLSDKVRQNSTFLSTSERIIRNSNKTHKFIIDMQSSFRGYLLTDDTTFLDMYYAGVKSVPVYLQEQRHLVRNNPQQMQLLDRIADMHGRWVDYSGQLINSRRSMSSSYLLLFESKLKKQVGKKLNDSIAVQFARFDKLEYAVRRRHSRTLLDSINSTRVMSLIFLGLTIITGIFSTTYIVILITKRIASMVRLAENISGGQFTIVNDTRNDELTRLSASLNIMSRNLDKTIRELEHRNTELSKFAHVVSHDLKAPIRGIHNVTKWMEEDFSQELTPQMEKYLAIIHQRTMRMEALINGLLDYARINRQTQPENVDTNALVHEIADLLVPRSFELHIDNLPELYTERLKLEQVFANLISNAVKFIPHEHGVIRITCEKRPGHYAFTVSDNGPGIDPAFHKKIFEIFQTLREKNEKESTGVGLAIVQKIMDERQERITVHSEPGKGASFTFTWRI